MNDKRYEFSEVPLEGSWSYSAESLTTQIITPMLPIDRRLNVTVRWPNEVKDTQHLLDGKAGLFGRLPKIAEMVKDEVNRRDNIANAPAALLKALSLPTRIQYQPERTMELLEEFDREYLPMLTSIMDYERGDANVLEMIVRRFPSVPPFTGTPVITLKQATPDQPATVTISCTDSSAALRYTLDGRPPTEASPMYAGPFTLDRTAVIQAKAFRRGCLSGFIAKEFFQRVWAKSIAYEFPNSPRYTGGGESALINGRLGTADDYRVDWVGFQDADLVATITLTQPRDVTSISTRFLQNQGSWIFLPTAIEYEVSSDGVKYKSVFQKDLRTMSESKSDVTDVFAFPAQCNEKGVTHIRVRAKNIGVCPAWHPGAGGKAWLFVDEVGTKQQE